MTSRARARGREAVHDRRDAITAALRHDDRTGQPIHRSLIADGH
ncbi:hypothetical protein [Streptomyces sediminimaris]